MDWTPLAERFASLPLILAGPMLRRAEPQSVTVWLALKETRLVTLRVYEQASDGSRTTRLVGTRTTVRLGDNLHMVAVTAEGEEPLESGVTYSYDISFEATAAAPGHTPESAPSLLSPGVLMHQPSRARAQQRLAYGDAELPTFV